MKKCPYCAEKIQNEAIVCRYCGHDLPVASEPSNNKIYQGHKEQRIATPPPKPSVWVQGAKVAAVFTVLAAIGIYIRDQNAPADLIGSLTIGSVANFLVWWLLVTGIISIWRKARETSWGKPVLAIGVLLLIVAGVVVLSSMVKGNTFAIFAPTPTSIPIPTSRPIPTSTPPPIPVVLYSDDFSNNQSGWLQSNSAGEKFQYSGGQYVINRPKGNYINWACANRSFTGAVLFVDAVHVSGDSVKTGPVVIWHLVDNNNFSYLQFTGDGYLTIGSYDRGEWQTSYDWAFNDAINRGRQINKITIVFGSYLGGSIYINGEEVARTLYQLGVDRPAGDICLGAFSDATSAVEVSFDNLVIYAINWGAPYFITLPPWLK